MHLGHGGQPCPAEEPLETDDPSDCSNMEDETDWESDKRSEIGDEGEDHDLLLDTWEFEPLDDDVILIVDLTGVRQCTVRWCCCHNAPMKHIQLLRDGLFSSSFKRPNTAFTFGLLDYFHIDSVECKTSATNFFSKLRRITNYNSPDSVPVSHSES